MSISVSINLPPELEQRLDSLATQTGRAKKDLLLQAIENGIYDVEDYYAAHEALERIRKGKGRTYTSAEIKAEFGLDS